MHNEFARNVALATGYITRAMIQDGIVSLSDVRDDPLWAMDPTTGNWHKFTREFFAQQSASRELVASQLDAATIALNLAVHGLAAVLPHQEDCHIPGRLAPNGQPYVVISSGGLSEEGTGLQRFPSSSAAIAEWQRRLLDYVASADGDTLWWRVRPEIDGRVGFGSVVAEWVVYSRLAVGKV